MPIYPSTTLTLFLPASAVEAIPPIAVILPADLCGLLTAVQGKPLNCSLPFPILSYYQQNPTHLPRCFQWLSPGSSRWASRFPPSPSHFLLLTPRKCQQNLPSHLFLQLSLSSSRWTSRISPLPLLVTHPLRASPLHGLPGAVPCRSHQDYLQISTDRGTFGNSLFWFTQTFWQQFFFTPNRGQQDH